MRHGAAEIAVADDGSFGDLAVHLGAHGESEPLEGANEPSRASPVGGRTYQEQTVHDGVAHADGAGGNVPAGDLQGAAEDDVSGKNEHDRRGRQSRIAENAGRGEAARDKRQEGGDDQSTGHEHSRTP